VCWGGVCALGAVFGVGVWVVGGCGVFLVVGCEGGSSGAVVVGARRCGGCWDSLGGCGGLCGERLGLRRGEV